MTGTYGVVIVVILVNDASYGANLDEQNVSFVPNTTKASEILFYLLSI
jgi:hypothetical protein